MRRLSDRRVVRFWLLASARGLGFGSAHSSLEPAHSSWLTNTSVYFLVNFAGLYSFVMPLTGNGTGGSRGLALLVQLFLWAFSVPGVGLKLDVDGPNFSDSIKGPLGFVYFVSWAQWILKRVIHAGDSSHHSIAQM